MVFSDPSLSLAPDMAHENTAPGSASASFPVAPADSGTTEPTLQELATSLNNQVSPSDDTDLLLSGIDLIEVFTAASASHTLKQPTMPAGYIILVAAINSGDKNLMKDCLQQALEDRNRLESLQNLYKKGAIAAKTAVWVETGVPLVMGYDDPAEQALASEEAATTPAPHKAKKAEKRKSNAANLDTFDDDDAESDTEYLPPGSKKRKTVAAAPAAPAPAKTMTPSFSFSSATLQPSMAPFLPSSATPQPSIALPSSSTPASTSSKGRTLSAARLQQDNEHYKKVRENQVLKPAEKSRERWICYIAGCGASGADKKEMSRHWSRGEHIGVQRQAGRDFSIGL